jgi:prevent-host-death family protein
LIGLNSVYILVSAVEGRTVKLSDRVKPLSYLKARAPEVIRTLAKRREPLIITVHGEAKAVLQDIASYEETQETLALLKILALSQKDLDEGRVRPLKESFARIRRRVKA